MYRTEWYQKPHVLESYLDFAQRSPRRFSTSGASTISTKSSVNSLSSLSRSRSRRRRTKLSRGLSKSRSRSRSKPRSGFTNLTGWSRSGTIRTKYSKQSKKKRLSRKSRSPSRKSQNNDLIFDFDI